MTVQMVKSRKALWLQQKGREFAALVVVLAALTLIIGLIVSPQMMISGAVPWFPATSMASIFILLTGLAVLLRHGNDTHQALWACLLAGVVVVGCVQTIYMQVEGGPVDWSVIILGRSLQWPYQKIAVNTLFDLILICIAVFIAKVHVRDWVLPRIIAVIVMINVLFVSATYINNANFFLEPMPITSSSVASLVCLFCLSISLLTLQPARGALWVYASTTIGGVIARRASLFIFGLPMLLSVGLFALRPYTSSHLLEWMSALFVLNVLLLILFVLYNAKNLAEEERNNRMLQHKNERLQSHLQSILDYSDSIVYVKDLQGRFVICNKKLAETFQKPEDYFIGKTAFDFLPKEDCEIYTRHDVEVQHLYQAITYEETALHPDGSRHTYLSSKFALRDKDNILYGIGGIATDITERAIQEEKLKQMNQELEAFSYSVSHDLRAPLRAIDGFGRALKEELGNNLNDSCQEYLSRMLRATEKMSRLIDDLLRLSRVSRQEVTLVSINLSQLCEDLFLEKAAWGLNSSVEVTVERDMFVQGDVSLIQVMMDNLISNALKFTSKTVRPKINVCLSSEDKQCVMVIDNGVGFDAKYQHKLFKVFQRLHRESDFPGTGIGLAIVSRIAEKQGITVWAESIPNVKTVFYLKFP